jgi:hypothetical protein
MQGAETSETPLDGVQACLAQLGRTLGIASRRVASVRTIDLQGLDGEVGSVCARILDLPPEQGRALRPALLALRTSLDRLTAAVAAQGVPAAASRPGEPQPDELQPGRRQSGQHQSREPQFGVPQPGEPQPGEPQPGAPQSRAPQSGVPRPAAPPPA